tara:strand:- start:649 stop:1095 length:447 start_codon:yes stop_codon:yes gene_type:complete
MANTAHLTQDQIDFIKSDLIKGYTLEDLSESELEEFLENYRIKQDTKKVKVTLLVEVDKNGDHCSGDPLKENCVLNSVRDFLEPVTVLDVSYYEEDSEFITLNWSKDLTQDQYEHIKKDLFDCYSPEDLTQREIEEALEDYEYALTGK